MLCLLHVLNSDIASPVSSEGNIFRWGIILPFVDCKKNVFHSVAGNCICKLYLTGISPFYSSLTVPDDFRKQMKLRSPRAWFGCDTFDVCLLCTCCLTILHGRAQKKCREPQHCSGLVSKTAGVSSPPNAPLCPRCAVLC
jgi:hypothetical protein